MSEKLKILILEDLPSDAMLVERELKKNGFDFVSVVVDNEKDFVYQLYNNLPDIVLSDYSLPQYNGLDALVEVLKLHDYMPFIIVTGSIDEETAADCIKAGATDYVTKERLVRLGTAVRGALDKKESLILRKKAETALLVSEEKFRHSFDYANIGMCLISLKGGFIKVNRALCEIFKKSSEQLHSETIYKYLSEDNIARYKKKVSILQPQVHTATEFEIDFIRSDGQVITGFVSISLVIDANKKPLYYVAHIQDITAKIKTQEKNRTLLKSAEQSSVSIIITNTNGDIEFVNPAFERVTGYSASECLGKNPRILKSDKLKKKDYKKLWKTISSGEIWRGEFLNKKKNGEEYWEFGSIAPVFNDNGKITHYIAAKEDITERKRMEKDLIAAKEKAEESDRLKSVFLATISHELRTPLNAILGFSSLLIESTQTEEKQAEYSNEIHKSGNKLLHIINDIIDISMIESRTIKFAPQNILIKDIFNKLLEVFSSDDTVQNGEIQLKVSLNDLADKNIYIDEDRLIKICSKLIENALKFTRKGVVEFGCLNSKSNNKVTFFVKDSGIGIPEELQTIIFERFRQFQGSYTRDFGGSGLGLAICSKLIEMMNGTIWVESEQGKGATFFFEIPIKPKSKTSIKSKVLSPTIKDKTIIPKVLVVDDFRANLMLFIDFINEFNFEPIPAINGEEALRLYTELDDISVVLLDIELPDINGMEVAARMKKINDKIPIIAQSAYALEGDREKFLNADFEDYIAKPIDFNMLNQLLEKYSKRS